MINTFEKEKNYLYYNTEKGTYKLDINTGIFYGLKNKPIKNNPPHFKQAIENYYNIHRMNSTNVMRLIQCFVSGYYGFSKKLFIELLPLMDSLDNLNIPFGTMYIDILVNTPKYFKSAIRLYNQLPKEEQETACFCNLVSAVKRADILKSFTPQQQITYRGLIFNLVNDNLDPEHIEKVKTIIHFINKYPHEFSPFEYEKEEGNENEKFYFNYQIKELFENFFRRAELFNFEIDRKGSFLKQYYALKNMEKTHLMEIKYNLGKYIYGKKEKALKYSNNDFTVVIPKTGVDFMNEANQQHNCVYNSYLQQVAKNNTYVVFIRKNEDLEKSYITCQISKQGEIKQYLEKYNSTPKDDNAIAFRKEYQAWLKENWE